MSRPDQSITVQTKQIVVKAQGTDGAAVTVDVPVIQQVVGGPVVTGRAALSFSNHAARSCAPLSKEWP